MYVGSWGASPCRFGFRSTPTLGRVSRMSSLKRRPRRSSFSRSWLAGTALGLLACSNSSSTDETSGSVGSGGDGAGAMGGNPGTPAGGTNPGTAPPNDSLGGATGAGGEASPGGMTGVGAPPSGGSAGSAPMAGSSSGNTSNTGTASGGESSGGGASGADTSNTGTSSDTSTPTQPDTKCDPSAAPAINRLGLETVVQSDDLQVVVYAAQPPGSDDWYLVDALGYVRVYSGGMLQPTPFLDVSEDVQDSGFTGGAPTGGAQNYDERGLLGIAFPPDYATSGKFYVTLVPTTIRNDDPDYPTDHDLILEYTRSADNPLVADPSTRKAILDLEEGGEGYIAGNAFSYAKYHNGSTVLFGPDGMLYVGMGDGGGDCNAARPGAPQDVSSPYGKILRLDPNAAPPYAAEGNPFAEGGDPRVWHYGLRNPFRFNFDSSTGDLYIGEVGQWSNDWVTYAPAEAKGLNFGWPSYEGVTENPTQQCASNVSLRPNSTRTPPIFNLTHGGSGGVANLIVAIVGGSVYRGQAIPELYGAYLFGEFYPNRPMRALYQCGSETSEVTVIQKRCDPNTPDAPCFAPVGGAPQLSQVGAIVEGNDGELYIPANGNALLKVVPAP